VAATSRHLQATVTRSEASLAPRRIQARVRPRVAQPAATRGIEAGSLRLRTRAR
jgi:hypothetical protein